MKENLQKNLKKILIDDGIEAISVVNPANYIKNIQSFERALSENHLKYAIHSVLKVNHSNVLLKTAFQNNLRADVSSLGELEQALKVGFTGERITANGPKNKKFLQKSVEIGATICVDSIEELEKIAKISIENHEKIKVLIRLSGFEVELNSRFGIRKSLWNNAIEIIQKSENLKVLGIHFQIGSLDLENRKKIFWESVDFFKKLLQIRQNPTIFNIGGSFGAYYQNDLTLHCKACARFSLGEKLYPQSQIAGPDFLKKFLTDTSHRGSSIANFLAENNFELWLEPGRAILSGNVGFVATTALGTREDCIIVNTNSFGVGMREEELPTNPVLLEDFRGEKIPQNHDFSYWILGNLCLESDIIYSRDIPFSRKIVEDDIIVFLDMAAYHMDFYETEAISHPKKLRFYEDENGNLFEDK